MTRVELVTAVGNVLTQIDIALQTPGKDDADWQTLYALRKHLDDQQRELVKQAINESDDDYAPLTTKLNLASDELKAASAKFAKVGAVIAAVAKISSYLDQILKLATPLA